ncbi:MAG TPA: aldehyde dehydrogenase family protein [Streptosporangiaceae bacterium]|nr:aldehyde dehydrogenase family protein [Streptosporangiaceae bacterium]
MLQLAALIDGKPVATDAEVPVEDPSTGEVMAVTADCGPAEIDAAVRAAAGAAQTWRRTAVPERARLLRRLAGLIERDSRSLGRLESQQTGKPLRQGLRDAEITVRYFDFYASAVETFYGSAFSLDERTAVQTRWEPHGVTAHIIPWNYPLQILGRSVAPALAMGNCVVLKPAEEAPLTALKIGELAAEAGLPPGALNVVPGYGESAGAALTAHPGIGHISFTGSVEVGRIISHAAADHLIPVTMELGGKSPNILFADADLDRALPVIVNSILQNGGQTCSAGSRLLVQDSIHAAVASKLAEMFGTVRIGPALDDPDLGPLISGPQRDRVTSYVTAADRGGRIAYGGEPLNGGEFGRGYFFQPTLIDEVAPGSPMFREEVFGPVLAVTPFADADQAVTLANGTDYGLVAGVWTTNVTTAQRMIRDVVSGQVFVNTYGASGGVELPFGGFRQSGFGREKGAEGLRGFAQLKTAVIAS